jgi:predicted TIM-barrel fold metal-dependent hydrolase
LASKMIVIDSHNHYFPQEVVGMLGVADGMDYAGFTRGRTSQCFRWGVSIERTVQVMDEGGVDTSVLGNSIWSPLGLPLCKGLNNAYAKIERDFPGRFISCGHVPLDGSAETQAELDRIVTELGLKAVSLVSSLTTMTLDSEKLFPLWEKIVRLNLPAIIHPTIRSPLWGATSFMMNASISREYDIAKATGEILNVVINRFPKLKFLLPHHGGGVPFLKGRIMARFEPEGWKVPEELKGLAKTPREMKDTGLDTAFEEYFSKLYWDTAGAGGWMPATEAATKLVRTDRLCFGTDYPFEIHYGQDVKLFVEGIKKLKISDTEKRNILGENLKRFLGIK